MVGKNKAGLIVAGTILGNLLATWLWAAEIEAVTRPSGDVLLSFVNGGRIAEILVQEGDLVEKNALLARQEEEVERLQLRQMEEKAANTATIEAVKADLAQKKQDLARLERARGEGAATDWEIDHAKLAIQTTEISLRQAQFDLGQLNLKRDELRAGLKLLKMHSPVAGLVEEVQIEPGESAQPLNPVLRVVQIDPLWIDVPVSLPAIKKLQKGQLVRIERGGDQATKVTETIEGKIINISAVADAASDTLRIRVELPNPQKLPAGERVTVVF